MYNSYLLETDYYYSAWVWIKRVGFSVLMLILLMMWDFSDMPPYGQFAVYVAFLFLCMGLFLSPIDDMAVDNTHFYHIKTSFLPLFSKIDKYEISKLQTIRCIGVHVPGLSIGEMATRRYQGGYTNTIEMSFSDGSYKSLEGGVYKEDVIEIILKIQELIQSQPGYTSR